MLIVDVTKIFFFVTKSNSFVTNSLTIIEFNPQNHYWHWYSLFVHTKSDAVHWNFLVYWNKNKNHITTMQRFVNKTKKELCINMHNNTPAAIHNLWFNHWYYDDRIQSIYQNVLHKLMLNEISNLIVPLFSITNVFRFMKFSKH